AVVVCGVVAGCPRSRPDDVDGGATGARCEARPHEGDSPRAGPPRLPGGRAAQREDLPREAGRVGGEPATMIEPFGMRHAVGRAIDWDDRPLRDAGRDRVRPPERRRARAGAAARYATDQLRLRGAAVG